ncbi:hypothetical protein J7438_20050 [Thalassotalea sp. G20_0]|uniref:hypothetical protein n=1 Tax=Thalassotalea sp. G20_0 TaxID=2821093 RepID=UPI001ADBCA6E|nr:hypothetical protein [Thalassotalea sp. G20_0]MBO9496353.1 hypothetical protein [Thalassotalea sp. G20_0]
MNRADLTGPFAPNVGFPVNDGHSPPVSPATVGPRAVYQLPVAALQPQLREQHHVRDTVPTTGNSWSGGATLPAHIKLSNEISQRVKQQLSDDKKCTVYYVNKSAADGVKHVQFTEYGKGLMRQSGFSDEELSSAMKMCSVIDASDTCSERHDCGQSKRQIHFVENPKVNEWIINHIRSSIEESDISSSDESDSDDLDKILQYSDGNRCYPLHIFGAMIPQTLVDARYVMISNEGVSKDEPPAFSVNVQKYISDTIANHHIDTLRELSDIVECSSDNNEKLSKLRDFLKPYRSGNPHDSEMEFKPPDCMDAEAIAHKDSTEP